MPKATRDWFGVKDSPICISIDIEHAPDLVADLRARPGAAANRCRHGEYAQSRAFQLLPRNLTARLGWGLALPLLTALLCLCCTTTVWASPPFDANDAMITETGHTEVFVFNEFEGLGKDFAGASGLDMTHGVNEWMQIGLVLPLQYEHAGGEGWQSGFGDIEVNTKIKLLQQEKAGLTLAIEPTMTLPTAKHGFGAGKVSAFFPIWLQRDIGKWSVYGGGGYHVNPGVDARNNWTGSVVATHEVSDKLMLGLEVSREGPDAADAVASSALRLGAGYSFSEHAALLLSGGPRFEAGGGQALYHGYLAILLNF